jgi:glycosyltransferase involved in cell wall biosynthesis
MMEETLKGGYRFHDKSPVKDTELPVVSVITVVYNGLSLIEKTITSVISQTYPNLEYIVIDGGSSDGTAEIIKIHEEKIAYWISEPDSGIYDAMNKGLAAATGDYVWFMNAGDLIYRPDTLQEIFNPSPPILREKSEEKKWAQIYYGDAMIVDTNYREIGLRRLRPPETLTWKSFRKGMLVCHQAIIVSRKIAEPFNPRYKHSADFDWVVNALKKAEGIDQKAEGRRHRAEDKAKGRRQKAEGREEGRRKKEEVWNTQRVLCAFMDGGHSKQNIAISIKERFQSMVHHYGLIGTVIRHVPIALRFGWFYLRNKRF